MNVPKTVRAWVADAEATYAESIDRWFPAEFDWKALCADAPAFAERLGGTWKGGTEAAARARLEELAVAAFRGAYVTAIALFAGYDSEGNPDEALERLMTAPDDDEALRLAALLAQLDEMELVLHAERPRDPKSGARPAIDAALAVLEPVRAMLAEGLEPAGRAVVGLGASPGPVRKALSGIVTIAVAVAGLRYQVAAEIDEAAGRPPLFLDLIGLETALGPPVEPR